ncbi:endopygalactorunase [Niabella pedocola]|uniref:Endopygalactorunase n=1 Tax=Niabella pedocola TaxID=1752077 RepID=A0ABS8PND5_9BACT|nr:endopygalactorunase [Niabella pedocola]MCD2422606.1 endopygalactorunase [Niabella pedocola]
MKFLTLLISTLLYVPINDLSAQSTRFENSRYVAGIKTDTLQIVSGSTYAFTVDTPEDGGLVSTTPSVADLMTDIQNESGRYTVYTSDGKPKTSGTISTGDRLKADEPGGSARTLIIKLVPKALGGQLIAEGENRTVNTTSDLTLFYTAGQRSPNATVTISLPDGVKASMLHTTVNIIGRGDVPLKDLEQHSTGRSGLGYPYTKTGRVQISDDGRTLLLTHLDLRPSNGPDIKMVLRNVQWSKTGRYHFKAHYTTTAPEVFSSTDAIATIAVTESISDLKRAPQKARIYDEIPGFYTSLELQWPRAAIPGALVEQSLDSGKTWTPAKAAIRINEGRASLAGLLPDRFYLFRLQVGNGRHKGASNHIAFYSGKIDIKHFGITGNGETDDTESINSAIRQVHAWGGGTLLFSKGVYNIRTAHLQSNVWLYVAEGAVIKALKGGDAPETTWYSDKKYRSGLSPTDIGPYEDPENWLTKQDVGHTFFRNAMFFGERIDNIKIVGNGYITGNGNLVTSDKVMNNAPDNRCDKMFSLKLCTNIEIGGLRRAEDLWYDSTRDEPYYILKGNKKDFDTGNMLHIDRAGHFVLLATGTDTVNMHDTYFAKHHTSNVRDIYDFMSCNDVIVTNIYSKVSSDDIVKPGSDCSLGFTRPARNYRIRNIIGDTNCNLFQIGSETADDITDICVDNIYVLGANKAGFSISTNDGGHIRNIHLNCGHTGVLHHRSKMLRTYTPFFISISNRGRVLGAHAQLYRFKENGTTRNELLVTNVNIGTVENIILNGIDISEVYAGSSFGKEGKRWSAFNGTQRTATPIVAGYRLPGAKDLESGEPFRLPNGIHTGYIKNITFNDVSIQVKGGHPAADTTANPPELGVGQYNASNLKLQPSWGIWARHVQNLTIKNSKFTVEQPDDRYTFYLDDAQNVQLLNNKTSSKISQTVGSRTVTGLTVR